MFDILGVDKVFCITQFKSERFENIVNLKNQLNLDIEFVYPVFNLNPEKSLKDTFINIIKTSIGTYNKILIFEDDAWSDLTYDEIKNRLQVEKNKDFQVMLLGGIIFEKHSNNKIKSFGFTHSSVINLNNVTDDFIKTLESIDKPLDVSLSLMAQDGFDFEMVDDSIFIQKTFESTIKQQTTQNFFLPFRYVRDLDITNVLKVMDEETYNFENTNNAWGYYCEGIQRKKIYFSRNDDTLINGVVFDYKSGAITHTFDINYTNFFVEFDLLTESVVLIFKEKNNIIYKKNINKND
jgi:hypothetical protein